MKMWNVNLNPVARATQTGAEHARTIKANAIIIEPILNHTIHILGGLGIQYFGTIIIQLVTARSKVTTIRQTIRMLL